MASSKVTTNAILSTASRLHAFATQQLHVFSSSRENESKFDLNLVTISIKIYLRNPFQNQLKIDPKSMEIGSWSHVGSRWHLLGAILAQDDPEDRAFIYFWPILGSPKCFKNRFKNEAIFRHQLKPSFLRMELTNVPKWRSKTTPKWSFFCTGPKPETRALARTRT